MKNNIDELFRKVCEVEQKSLQWRLLIDKENKIVVLIDGADRIVVKCHPDDKFDWRIGLGIALSKKWCKTNGKNELEFLKKKLKEKDYYLFCFYHFCKFEDSNIAEFTKIVESEQAEYEEAIIKEKVKEAECGIRNLKYTPTKINHRFLILSM